MVTMQDVARHANVSQASVSFAFNRPEKLSREVRDNILAVAQRLRYPGPNPAAKSLRLGRAGAIGFVVGDELAYALEDPAITQMLRGIGSVSDLSAVALTILPSPGQSRRAGPASNRFQLIRQAHVDGFLFETFPDDLGAIETALSRGLPVVTMGVARHQDVLFVTIDERAAARLAAEHVLVLGHRRIAILADRLRWDGKRGPLTKSRRASALNYTTSLRLDGYQDAFEAAGERFDDVPVFEAGGFLKSQADAAAADLLTLQPGVTAVIAVSDLMAIAVVEEAERRGLRVPNDLSIVGFDDVPAAAERGLTTIRQSIVEKSRLAAQTLIDTIAGVEASSCTLPAYLVARRTTSRPGE